jgi:HK97 family phage prohead protease
MTMERRALTRAPELREGKTAKGYAALFNSETDIGGYFRETIAPGAFAATLKDSDVRALVDHDSGRVIGRSSAGTLRLSEDDTGLAVEIDLPDTSDGRDLAVLMERGDISGMSFGFRVTKEQWDETLDPPTRTILAAELFEVSAVAFPAYEDTTIALRSLEAVKEEARQRAADNAKRAVDRIAARKAKMEQQFRGINAA